MSQEKKVTPGTFGWNELVTSDAQAAIKFYNETLGWEAKAIDMPQGMQYTIFRKDDQDVAGMIEITSEMGPIPPHWMSYVNSQKIEKDVEKAKAAGATILHEMEIPETGKLAVIQDPQGAVFSFWEPTGDCT